MFRCSLRPSSCKDFRCRRYRNRSPAPAASEVAQARVATGVRVTATIFMSGNRCGARGKIERGRALEFGVLEIGGTGSATVFQAISTNTLLEPVSLSARQRPSAIGESATATFPRMQHARNQVSAGCPRILGGVLNLRETRGNHFLLRIARHHPDYAHRFRAPQIAATDSGSPVDRRPNPPRLG